MKMATGNVGTIERVDVGAEQEFTIDFSAKMASILADGLYSDKIQSVIRELSCNAVDSHVAAGHPDKPIEVHFPNRFEAWYHVQDFGTGLSHDEVMSIYTRYGASTKTNSNDFIGALGLGSKSPFALTDAFTVTSRKDGIENHYSMFRNEQSMPSVAHLHQNATTEPNGVKVTVPVRDDQRAEFIEKSKNVYKWFSVKPVTIGDTIEYDTIDYQYQGTGWGICKKPVQRGYYNRYSEIKPVALMGLVAYPLDINSIKGLSEGARNLLESGTVLTFSIGELEIAANREALGYDERTCAAIVAKMDVMIAELGAIFEKEIANADTLWNAKKAFGKIFSKGDYSNSFARAFNNLGLKWNNQVIKEQYQRITPGKLYGITDAKYADCNVYLANHHYKRGRRLSFYEDESYSIECEDNIVIMYNDLKRGGLVRVTEYNKANNGQKRIYVFNPHDKVSLETLCEALGNPGVVLTSSLPQPVRKQVTRTGVYKYVGGYNSSRKAWIEAEIDLEDGGYYVDLDGWDHTWNGKYMGDINWWLARAVEADIIPNDTVVYAMRNKNKKIVGEHEGWTNLVDKVKESLEEMFTKRDFARDFAYAEEHSKLTENSGWEFWNYIKDIKDPTSPMTKFVETVKEYKKASEGLNVVQALMSKFDIKIEQVKTGANLVLQYNVLMARYPMLHFASDRYSYAYRSGNNDAAIQRVVDYINLVDSTAVFVALQDAETEQTR